jgi:hypothetical protein
VPSTVLGVGALMRQGTARISPNGG